MIEIESDNSGRLVIPKGFRRALGVKGPAQWLGELRGSALIFKPKLAAQGKWRRKGKTWVLTEVAPVDPVAAVASLREEANGY